MAKEIKKCKNGHRMIKDKYFTGKGRSTTKWYCPSCLKHEDEIKKTTKTGEVK